MTITTDGSLVVRSREVEVVIGKVEDAVTGDVNVLRSTSFVLNMKLVVGILIEESVETNV